MNRISISHIYFVHGWYFINIAGKTHRAKRRRSLRRAAKLYLYQRGLMG